MCDPTRMWHARSVFPTVMAQIWRSWTSTTPGSSNNPLSTFRASISRGVLSIKIPRMSRIILIVVARTRIENRRVQTGSINFHFGLYQMAAPPIITPTLWRRSPRTCKYAPCTLMLRSDFLFDKSRLNITLFVFKKGSFKPASPWLCLCSLLWLWLWSSPPLLLSWIWSWCSCSCSAAGIMQTY